MDWKIGEIRKVNEEWYQCVRSITCSGCGFNNGGCTADKHLTGDCSGRLDGASVIFKRLKKVGKPFERNGYMYQEYKTHTYPLLMSGDAKIPTDNGFAVIIKQKQRRYGKSR